MNLFKLRHLINLAKVIWEQGGVTQQSRSQQVNWQNDELSAKKWVR